jgi:UDP-GlcNAc:undecaprenyl-phosphate/decaprenyl-phosphate GlcNAc-1-phosphate transferase
MQPTENFYFHLFQPEFRVAVAFILAMILNAYAIPVILRIAWAKKLYDVPKKRGSHTTAIPTLGGLGIYFSIVTVGLTLINTCGMNGGGISSSLTSLPPIIAGFTLIFFVGMKDDLLHMPAWKKLIAEVIALFILTVIGDVRLNSMQGMFFIDELNYSVSIALSIFAGIVIINALNLIDGIDGLASSIAMLGSIVFGSYFLKTHEWEYAVLTFTLLGALIPFFLYNTFGKENKIFMGDTGSLILGFAMTVLVFRFNQMNSSFLFKPHFMAGPAFSFAVLIVPLFDTLRVFAIRIYRKRSPFKADRRHIHHLLLDFGFSHLQTTMILIFINILFIVFVYLFDVQGNSNLVFIMLAFALLISGVAMKLNRIRVKRQEENSRNE